MALMTSTASHGAHAAGPAEPATTVLDPVGSGASERSGAGPATVALEPIIPSRAEHDEAIITLTDVSVAASWGHIYGPVSLSIKRGGVTVLVGSGGRGRTALLLTIAGRMAPTTGSIVSFGLTDKPHELFKRAGVGFINEVDEIVQAIRVRDVVTEQLRWRAPWFKWLIPATQADVEDLCRPVFGDLPVPDINDMVEELPELTAALFRIAAANARGPEVLVVGGIDNLTSIKAASVLLGRLVELGKEQTIVTADVNGVREGFDVLEYIEVSHLTNDEFPNVGATETETQA